MRRVFKLTHPKTKVDRLVESVKSDVRKYLKRERKNELPDGVDFWDFACKFGPNAETATVTHVNDLGKCISAAADQNLESVYIEILAKPGRRLKKKKKAPSERKDLP